jgi:flagellar motor component MotA
MSRRPAITKEEVETAIHTLRKNGEKISERNVHRITGGSFSTLRRLITEILDQEQIEAMAPEISETLLKALKSGIGNAIKTGLELMKAQREDALVLLDELDAEMIAAAKQSQEKISQLKAENLAAHEQRTKAETLLSAANNRIDFLEKQCQELISGSPLKDIETIVQKAVDAVRATDAQH